MEMAASLRVVWSGDRNRLGQKPRLGVVQGVKVDPDLARIRIRGLQGIYEKEHRALVEWGLWSLDRRGIFPTLKPPSVWDQFKRSEVEAWGDAPENHEGPAEKAELLPRVGYNERMGLMIDERIHGVGGLPDYVRLAMRVAYVTREVPEDQFPRLAGCSLDAYCERLEHALRFVGRFL